MRERIKFHSKRLTLFFIQLAFLAGVCYIGEAVSVHLPVEVPANICSMGILLSLLISGMIDESKIELVSSFLLKYMPVFFIPAGVTILRCLPMIGDRIGWFALVCIITTVLVFLSTALTVILVGRLQQRRPSAWRVHDRNRRRIAMDFASVLEAGGSLALSIGVFAFAVWLNRKTNSPLLNPLLVTVAIIMIGLTVFNIPLDSYEKGATLISSMLGPATAVLAFSIYQQRKILQSNFLPIFVGCLVGSTVSMVSAYGLCELFGLGDQVALSTLPKSTTAPIALAVTGELGGTASITMAAVMTTGVMGAIFSPMLANLFHIKNKVAQGVAIGTCSHAVGTAKALEMGKLEGAMSGVAIAVSGLLTCFIVIAATSIM